jgi:hypothetical protein
MRGPMLPESLTPFFNAGVANVAILDWGAQTACALGVGALSLFRDRGDIRTTLVAVERWLSGVALVCYLVFCLVIGYTMIFSNLTMDF